MDDDWLCDVVVLVVHVSEVEFVEVIVLGSEGWTLGPR